jgi:hypothetical protein
LRTGVEKIEAVWKEAEGKRRLGAYSMLIIK